MWIHGKHENINPARIKDQISGAQKTVRGDNPQKFAADKDRKGHVSVMLLASVNTPSHLQSAETLVCLHCLAECLPNSPKQTS